MSKPDIKVTIGVDPTSYSVIQDGLDKQTFKIKVEPSSDTASQLEKQMKGVKMDVDTSAANKNISQTSKSIAATQKSAQSLGSTLRNVLNIGSSAALVAKGFRLIATTAKNAVKAVKDIDGAIANLRIATGANYDTAKQLVSAYNQMAKTLGATTVEVADSAETWLRQGKSIQEANMLIKDSMILSKVGMLDSAEAAKALTSSMKGYGVGVNDDDDRSCCSRLAVREILSKTA